MSLLDEIVKELPEEGKEEPKSDAPAQESGEKKSMFTYSDDFREKYGEKRNRY